MLFLAICMKFSESAVKKFSGYYVNHQGFRRDLKRIAHILKNADKYSEDDLPVLRQWFELHEHIIHEHHHAEDEFFFGRMQQHLSSEEDIFKQSRDEHVVMVEILERLHAAFAAGALNQILEILQKYYDGVQEHLDNEEELFLSVIEDVSEDWAAQTEKEFLKTVSASDKLSMLGWALEDMDALTKKYFWSKLPFPVKAMYKLRLKPRYTKLIAAVTK